MEKREQLYEGKAKIIYATDDPSLIIQYFKDDATAFNAEKKGTIAQKGIMNHRISATLFKRLENEGVSTHYVDSLSDREMLCKKLDIVLVETVMRNVVAGSLMKRTGRDTGFVLPRPIIEYFYKDDALGDPMITWEHIDVMGLCSADELAEIERQARKVNDILNSYFDSIGITLVDFKLEFGRHGGQILLGDEICPDTCRLWDKESKESLDKDRFRKDLGKIPEAYQEITRRVCGEDAVPVL